MQIPEDVRFELWLEMIELEADARKLVIVEAERRGDLMLFRLDSGVRFWFPVHAPPDEVVDCLIDVKSSILRRDGHFTEGTWPSP